ncbi:MAG TPA: efflux RND transporter periplasmic adaptor subunit [Steroidobacteraceae bacterium]|jgi:membrane fusion protein (multidrug efflux system)|nr:efflux RND transporter periplasmic adaptor subunit [Steroidobacteraceae bacterium]
MISFHPAAAVRENRIAALAALALLCAACTKAPPPAPHPVDVATVIVHPQPTSFPEDFVAETEAINAVEIRPRVGGELVQRVPNEGERVKNGELLFVIDREPYIAALAQAKAGLAQSEAALAQSQRDLERAESLSKLDAVSLQELDAAVAKNKANLASIEAGKGAVRAAELNLGFTTIVSPIDGVVGRAQLRQGGMVTANSTLLTTVYETDRMYVNFSISERRMLTLQRDLGRAASQDATTPPPFRVFLADGSLYPQIPKLNFIDPAVDTRTGTLAIRLEVDNPQHLLHAGQFARVQVSQQVDPNAIVLPQRAILDQQGQNYVWIVDAEGKAQQREVHMGLRLGGDWQVQQGLKAGEVVIVDGVQRLKPGTPVKATPLVLPVPVASPAIPAGPVVPPASTSDTRPAAEKGVRSGA